jgi:hypothetical protein
VKETHIDRLMSRKNIPYNVGRRIITLGTEESMCVEFADLLRINTINGSLRAVWTHVPNEGKRGWLVALIMRAMGMIPGCPDYIFLWQTGSGVIEFKAPKGKIQPNQKDFKEWCDNAGIRHAYCYNLDAAVEVLRAWNVLVK